MMESIPKTIQCQWCKLLKLTGSCQHLHGLPLTLEYSLQMALPVDLILNVVLFQFPSEADKYSLTKLVTSNPTLPF